MGATMNSPVLRRPVQPRMGAALFYEMARLVGIQALAGFAILGVYLAGEVGHQVGSLLIWVFAAGIPGMRLVFWQIGRKLDHYADMPANNVDRLSWLLAASLGVMGAAVYFEWL